MLHSLTANGSRGNHVYTSTVSSTGVRVRFKKSSSGTGRKRDTWVVNAYDVYLDISIVHGIRGSKRTHPCSGAWLKQ